MDLGNVGSEEIGSDKDLWVITSFFNPAGYRRPREKYRIFREQIRAPLLTVELGYGREFELDEESADRLIQFRSEDVLWQKERLLNLAIEALPEECRYVAWVDADIVFEQRDWVERTRDALARWTLVQPFSWVHDLSPQAGFGPVAGEILLTRPSLGWLESRGEFDPSQSSRDWTGLCSPGHAWAMRREVLQEVGLYDAMILGSADNAMAMGALGHIERVTETFAMSDAQARHYRRWAKRFHAATQGAMGVVEGHVHHLWHGDLANRAYKTRYPGIAPFEFDPENDIALDENGAWRWASCKPGLHDYAAEYFRSRKEDG